MRQLCAWIWIAVASPAADTWTQWRGPERTGEVAGPEWPDNLQGLASQWRVDLDAGYPGPIVNRTTVFTVETRKKKEEVVRAFDRETGEEKWRHAWAGAMSVPFFARANGSWVRSTPACDDDSIYVGGMKDVLVSLDTETGEERWRVDFKQRYKSKNPSFGLVCSPLLDGEFIYLQAGGGFCKLRKDTGESVWRTLADGGGMYGSAFSSPVLTEMHGRPTLLVQTRSRLAGVDPESGDELWSQEIEAFRGMNILTPTVRSNQVFTSSYGGGSFLLDVTEADGEFGAAFAWRNKVQGYMSSPLLIGDHLYIHLRNERFACMEFATGETAWTSPKAVGKYMSLAHQGDRVLALDNRGGLRLVEANPEKWTVLDSRKVSDQDTWGHIAVAGDQVFVRELKGLAVFRWK